MTAALVEVAEAITREIGEIPDLVRDVEAERSYADWDLPLEEFDELRVDVVPVNVSEIELETRGAALHVVRSYIAVRYRFRPEERTDIGRVDVAEVDELILLLQQINNYFINGGQGRRLLFMPEAVWTASDVRTWYMREHLREMAQFTGIIELKYEVTT